MSPRITAQHTIVAGMAAAAAARALGKPAPPPVRRLRRVLDRPSRPLATDDGVVLPPAATRPMAER
jgi:hypothetical protein